VLAPVKGAKPSKETLEQAKAIIRQRVDGVGVAEPDITRQGGNIVIQLPGVKDTDRVLALVGQTAQLRFRPVLNEAAPGPQAPPTTPREGDTPEATVVLPEKKTKGQDGPVYQLGPALADGTIISTARAAAPQLAGNWQVDFELTGKGSGIFDGIAAKCNPPDPKVCPSGRLAIVLDGVVKSAPNINTNKFNGKGQITGTFSEREAKDLALVLRYGSLPVELVTQQRQTVSPSLGKESLKAGLIAGGIGLALVLLYMILYYRALGIVVLLGLTVSGGLLYSILTYLSKSSFGLALSLAGATGVIVSVGVTVDSYIVYFERLKDDLRSGRSVKASVGRSFNRAWRTILVADGTSFIGAAILFVLTVGPVRGFAFTLALSTALDVVVAWFFTRPMVALLGRSRFFTEARFFGLNRSLAKRTPAVEVPA